MRVIEIGSFEGRSATYLIEKCVLYGHVELFCIDSWQGGVEHDPNVMTQVEARFDSNIAMAVAKTGGTAQVRKLKSLSNVAVAGLIATEPLGSFDLVYIDGSHQAPDVLSDAVLSFPLLKVGGLMIFDDYLWTMEAPGKQDPLNMPKPAIDAFINLFQRKLKVEWGAPLGQIYVHKTAL